MPVRRSPGLAGSQARQSTVKRHSGQRRASERRIVTFPASAACSGCKRFIFRIDVDDTRKAIKLVCPLCGQESVWR